MDSPSREYLILIAEGNQLNLELLLHFLMDSEYRLASATTSEKAIEICEQVNPDLILMDVDLPDTNGFETAKQLLNNDKTGHIPVIFTADISNNEVVTNCFEYGGVDYISKPFKKPELLARINTHLSLNLLRKQLHTDQNHLTAILHNMLPNDLINSLKNGSFPKPKSVESAAALFTDFKNFSTITKNLGSQESVNHLNLIYFVFDEIVESFGLERIKTIGDAYFAVGGINTIPDHLYLNPILAALKMQEFVQFYSNQQKDNEWLLRIGFTTGPVTSGIIGYQKIAYDVWGDTVNLANYLENRSYPGQVAVSDFIYEKVSDHISTSHMDTIRRAPWGTIHIYHCDGIKGTLPDPQSQIMQKLDPESLLKLAASKKSLLKRIYQIPGDV